MPRKLSSRLDQLEHGQGGKKPVQFEVWTLTDGGMMRNERTGEFISTTALHERSHVFTLHLGDATPE